MRLFLFAGAAAAAGAVVCVAQTPAANPDAAARAKQVLEEARKALGGEKLAAVKTLVASGRTRRVRGNNIVPIEFQMFIELPEKYVRVDEFPAEDADPTSSGFSGDSLIQIPPPAPGSMPGRGMTMPAPGAAPAGGPPRAPAAPLPPGAPAPPPPAVGTPPGTQGAAPPAARAPVDPRRARVNTLKQEYARLTLGLFAASPSSPLTFAYAAVAEAPQGRADVLDVKGEGNFAARLFVNSETRLPIMVTWNTPPTSVIVTVPGQPPPKTIAPGVVVVAGPPPPAANAPKEELDKYTKDVLALRTKAQTTPVEHRLYFSDYRDVEGVRFPFRLRRAIGTETTEETTFDRFRINTRIDPRRFDPVK